MPATRQHTNAGNERTTAKQSERLKAGGARAKRIAILAKRRRKARRLAFTSFKLVQSYAHTVNGLSPSQLNEARSNLATAIGIKGAGACSTTAIE